MKFMPTFQPFYTFTYPWIPNHATRLHPVPKSIIIPACNTVSNQGCNIMAAAFSIFGRLEASSVTEADLFKGKLGQTPSTLVGCKTNIP
jgi:hypothetical protein